MIELHGTINDLTQMRSRLTIFFKHRYDDDVFLGDIDANECYSFSHDKELYLWYCDSDDENHKLARIIIKEF